MYQYLIEKWSSGEVEWSSGVVQWSSGQCSGQVRKLSGLVGQLRGLVGNHSGLVGQLSGLVGKCSAQVGKFSGQVRNCMQPKIWEGFVTHFVRIFKHLVSTFLNTDLLYSIAPKILVSRKPYACFAITRYATHILASLGYSWRKACFARFSPLNSKQLHINASILVLVFPTF